MNTIGVPRKASDASGALMTLTADHGAGRSLTVNVEYNQLDALVRASIDARGDFNDSASGCSPSRATPTSSSSGSARTTPRSGRAGRCPSLSPGSTPTRRGPRSSADAPRVHDAGPAVGAPHRRQGRFHVARQGLRPSRTHPDAVEGRRRRKRRRRGGRARGVRLPPPRARPAGATCRRRACRPSAASRVSLPALASSSRRRSAPPGAALGRLVGGSSIRVSARSSLYLDGDVTVHALDLDGALAVSAVAGARVTVRRLKVSNAGYTLGNLSDEELAAESTPSSSSCAGMSTCGPHRPTCVSFASMRRETTWSMSRRDDESNRLRWGERRGQPLSA